MFKERIYKIWKQFTTASPDSLVEVPLCSKNEYTKSESNSQLFILNTILGEDCVQRTNIQNLKAIHNSAAKTKIAELIVFKERIYKIWKQFTTWPQRFLKLMPLCSKNEYTKSESNSQRFCICWRHRLYCVQRTNIQNLKAIHNEQVRQYDCGQAAGACVVAAEPPSSGMGWLSR